MNRGGGIRAAVVGRVVVMDGIALVFRGKCVIPSRSSCIVAAEFYHSGYRPFSFYHQTIRDLMLSGF